jgi:hypothetical protein
MMQGSDVLDIMSHRSIVANRMVALFWFFVLLATAKSAFSLAVVPVRLSAAIGAL